MARSTAETDQNPNDDEWVSRHQQELAAFLGASPNTLERGPTSPDTFIDAGGGYGVQRATTRDEYMARALPAWAQPAPADPFAGLRPIGDALGAAGRKVEEGFTAAAQMPVVGGALQGISAAFGETVDPAFGLIHKTASGADSRAERAYQEQRKTLDGGEASPLDFFATTRGLRAAHAAGKAEAAEIASDTSRHPVIRALAGVQGGANTVAENVVDIPGLGLAGSIAKGATRPVVRTAADVVRDIRARGKTPVEATGGTPALRTTDAMDTLDATATPAAQEPSPQATALETNAGLRAVIDAGHVAEVDAGRLARQETRAERARITGQREAIRAIQDRMDETLGNLTRELTEQVEGKEPSAYQVASALKRIADELDSPAKRAEMFGKDRGYRYTFTSSGRSRASAGLSTDSGAGELHLGGQVGRARSPEYEAYHSENVAPVLDLRQKITKGLDRIREIDRGQEMKWARLSPEEQLVALDAKYPDLFGQDLSYVQEWKQALRRAAPEEQKALIDQMNDYIDQVERFEADGGAPLVEYRRIGQGPTAEALITERSRLLEETKAHVEQARERFGVDARITEPIARRLSGAIEEISDLRAAIEQIEPPELPKSAPSTADPVVLARASVNTDYIGNPLVVRLLADLVRADPARYEARTARLTVDEQLAITNDLATMLGDDPARVLDFLKAKVQGRGEVGPLLRLGKDAFEKVALDIHSLASRGIEGKPVDELIATFQGLVEETGAGVSEAARATALQKVGVEARAKDVAGAEAAIASAERLLKDTRQAWEAAAKHAADEAERAAKAEERAARPGAGVALRHAANNAAESAAKAEKSAAQQKLAYDRVEAARYAALDRAHRARQQGLIDAMVRAAKRGAKPETLRAIAALDPQREFQKVVNLLRNVEKVDTGEKLVTFMLNNIYSGARANEANVLGNALRLGWMLTGDPVASVTTSPLIARLTGRAPAIVPVENRYAMLALKHSLPRALRSFTKVLAEGRGAADIADFIPEGSKFELGRPDVFPGKKGAIIEPALRLLSGVDTFFFHVAHAVETDRLYARRAWVDGARTDAEIASKMADYIANPPEKLLAAAGEQAAQTTYRGALDRLSQAVVDLVSVPFPVPGLGRTPFLKLFLTPIMFTANAAKYAVEASGGGVLRGMYLARKASGMTPEEAAIIDRQAARTTLVGAVGGLLLWDAINAYANGDLTGEGPSDPTRQRIWRQTHQPMSRKVGNEWKSLDQWWPASAPYLLTARIADAVQEGTVKGEQAVELMVRAAGAFGQAIVLDQPFVSRLHSYADVVDQAQRGGITRGVERFGATTAQKAIPDSSFLRDLSRALDPYERDPRKFVEYLEASLPELSKDVRPRLDRWGRPVRREPGGADYLNPLAGRPVRTDPVDAEVQRLEAAKNPKNGKPYLERIGFVDDDAGAKLDADEHHRYQELAGENAYERIAGRMKARDYAGLSDVQKGEELAKAVRFARAGARKQLFNELMGSMPDGRIVETSPEKQAKGLAVLLSTSMTNYERAKIVGGWLSKIDKTPGLAEEFDRHVGKKDPTLAVYREVIPLLEKLDRMPKFADGLGRAIGTEKEWKRYAALKKQYKAIGKRADLGEVDRRMTEARFRIEHLADFTFFYNRENGRGGANPQVTDLKHKYPILERFPRPEDDD